jgi:subtilisin family serine protease
MRIRDLALSAALVVAVTGTVPTPAAAAVAPAVGYYYTVTNPRENLWAIADRFLGDAERAGEILDLNAGRVQPDGRRLSDPASLRVGWHLVLPWDAVGAELNHGPLPTVGASSSDCAASGSVPAEATWGQAMLTPDRAWSAADGSGVKVAVIAAGVNGSAPELANRVATGADVLAGTGRGDIGCEGAGTALAGIVAGDDDDFGIAPGARIVPIRAGASRLPNPIAARSITVATGTGADVLLLGVAVDATDRDVRAAIDDAIAQDVVVVLPATVAAAPADGLLRVGAAGADQQAAESYPDGAVDLLAPGVGVATIGRTGTGAEYAAAFVAGAVALVRSAHPGLPAADVTRQVRATVTSGLVSPVAAVTTPLPGGVGVNAAAEQPANRLATLSRVLTWFGVGLVLFLVLGFLLQPPVRAVTGVLARRRARLAGRAARARMSDDNDDPFWHPPTSGAQPAP